MRNYIAFFDQASLMKLKSETGLSVYEIMQEIEPCSYLDTSGRALTNQFTPIEDRYIDFNNVRGSIELPKEKLAAIKARFDQVGIKIMCEEKDYSIQDIYSARLCKATLDQLGGWRRKKRREEKMNGAPVNE